MTFVFRIRKDNAKTFSEMVKENAQCCKGFPTECCDCKNLCGIEKWVRLDVVEEGIQKLNDEITFLRSKNLQKRLDLTTEILLQQSERIKRIREHLKTAPKYTELDDIGGMESYNVQDWGSRAEKWIKKLVGLVEQMSKKIQVKEETECPAQSSCEDFRPSKSGKTCIHYVQDDYGTDLCYEEEWEEEEFEQSDKNE